MLRFVFQVIFQNLFFFSEIMALEKFCKQIIEGFALYIFT